MQLSPLHEEFGTTITGIDLAKPVGRGEITYLGTVGNIDADGNQLKSQSRSVRSGAGNNMWHSDSSFREIPSSFSILFAHEVPAEGGETEFVSTRAAYKRLDKTLQHKIEPLVGIHDYIFSRTKVSEDAVTSGQREFMYPVRQKLVRKKLFYRLTRTRYRWLARKGFAAIAG